jgi:MGT family glycosyltransferase
MAHFAILCPEAGGHLFPTGSLGHELRRRGHQVTIVARSSAAPIAERLELPLHELPEDDGPDHRRPARPLMTAAWLIGLGNYVGLRSRFRYNAEFYLEVVPGVLRELQVDGLLADQTILAGGTIAERLKIPFVSICSAMHWNREPEIPPHFTGWTYAQGARARTRNALGYAAWDRYVNPALKLINRYRTTWQLPPLPSVENIYSPLAEIAQTCPEFDFPRRDLPATFHYVGALAADRPCDSDEFPWDRLDGRPLIYASLGTIRPNRTRNAFQKIAAACAGLDAQLVISTGRWADESEEAAQHGLSDLPGDPIVMDFVPQPALLKKADLLITHAGQNTTVEALTLAVPMIALPRAVDQPALAARIEYAGVGLRASFLHFTVRQLRELIRRVLNEESFRERARELQRAMAAVGGVRRAADITEQALTTGRAVARQSTE